MIKGIHLILALHQFVNLTSRQPPKNILQWEKRAKPGESMGDKLDRGGVASIG